MSEIPEDVMKVGKLEWKPIDSTTPSGEIFFARDDDGFFALCSLERRQGKREIVKKFPWSKPKEVVTDEGGTYLYIAIPAGGHWGNLVPRFFRPVEWLPIEALPW